MMIRLDWMLGQRILVLCLLLLWPLFLVGRPAYISDSASYFKGGKAAVEFVTAKLTPHLPMISPQASTQEPGPAAETGTDGFRKAPKGVRSVTYSVAAYLLRWPGIAMTALALVQIVCAAFICTVAAMALGAQRWGQFLAVGAIVAFGTPLAPLCANVVPDVFSGFVIATVTLMALLLDRMSMGVRFVIAFITVFAVTAHPSNPPLALGLMLLGGGVLLARGWLGLPRVRWAWPWLVLPPLLGFFANIAIGYAAFGEVSVSAKRFPTALTRSVVDGPARWYLEKHCATEQYAVCEVFGTEIPETINDFLFYAGGLNGRATPEQMDRIRAEEAEIVMRAALAYPGYEAYNLSRNVFRQLFRFDLGQSRFKERLALDSDGIPQLVPSGLDVQPVMVIVGMLTKIVLLICLAWTIWNFKRLHNRARVSVFLVIAGLVGNATIVVAFSSLASRYQARVIWVLPLFILSIAVARFDGFGRKSAQAVNE